MLKQTPAGKPPSPSAPETPAVEPETVFAPSAQLGDQLDNFGQAQAEIDRQKAAELARLRAIQDRD